MVDADFPTVPQKGRIFPSFAFIGWRWISLNPAAAAAPVLVPFIFLYFLWIIAGPAAFPAEVVGAMLFTTQNVGSWVLGDSATWRLETILQDLFVASPVGKLRYIIGIAVSNLIAALPALFILGVLLVIVAPGPLPWVGWVVLVVCLLVLWLLFSAVGIALSSRIRTRRAIWPIGNLTFTMLGMLSPLYYPLSVLPPAWQDAALFFPGTYAAIVTKGAFRLTAGGEIPIPSNATILTDLGLLVVLAGIGLALCYRLYKWRAT